MMDLNINLNTVAGVQPDEPARPPFVERTPAHWEFHIDNSTLEKFMACPKSAEYYVLRRREPLPSPALAFGGAIHAGLETLYRLGNDIAGQAAARQSFMTAITERPVRGGDWRTADFGLQVLDRYFAKYKHDEFANSIYEHNNEPFIERAFAIELGTIELGITTLIPNYTRGDLLGPDCEAPDAPACVDRITVYYTGKLDLAINKAMHVWVTDHKTTTILGDGFWAGFEMSAQTLGYCWAFRHITGKLPAGALINCLALRKPTPTGKPIRFERQSFFYAPEKIDEWKDDTMTLVADFLSHTIRGYFPRTRLWCTNKYGKCKYFDVCASLKCDRRSVLSSSQFSNVTWDPTA